MEVPDSQHDQKANVSALMFNLPRQEIHREGGLSEK